MTKRQRQLLLWYISLQSISVCVFVYICWLMWLHTVFVFILFVYRYRYMYVCEEVLPAYFVACMQAGFISHTNTHIFTFPILTNMSTIITTTPTETVFSLLLMQSGREGIGFVVYGETERVYDSESKYLPMSVSICLCRFQFDVASIFSIF